MKHSYMVIRLRRGFTVAIYLDCPLGEKEEETGKRQNTKNLVTVRAEALLSGAYCVTVVPTLGDLNHPCIQ